MIPKYKCGDCGDESNCKPVTDCQISCGEECEDSWYKLEQTSGLLLCGENSKRKRRQITDSPGILFMHYHFRRKIVLMNLSLYFVGMEIV